MTSAFPGIRRIAVIVEAVLSPRDRERFGVDWMLAQGLHVTVFDIGAITRQTARHDYGVYDGLENLVVRIVRDPAQLAGLAGELAGHDLAFALFGSAGIQPANLAAFRWLSRAGLPFVTVNCDTYPGHNRFVGERVNLHKRLKDVFDRLCHGQISLTRSLAARIPPSWLGIRVPDFTIHGGVRSRLTDHTMGPETRVIALHSLDYEIARAARTQINGQTGTAVFIDEYLPFHPDLADRGQGAPVDPDYYFDRMRALFDRIEAELGLEVVIAACPRADYQSRPDIMGNRRIVFRQTARLVGESRLVIAHRSTAIGFAAMFGRPVLLVGLAATYNHINHRIPMDAFAEALHTPVHLADDVAGIDLGGALTVDEEAYGRYMADYVKAPGSPDTYIWETILGEIARSIPLSHSTAA